VELQAFPKDESITRKAIEKAMDLRVQGGEYEGRKPPFYGDFIESSVIEEARSNADYQLERYGNPRLLRAVSRFVGRRPSVLDQDAFYS
jgi:hypothetical protein